MANAKNAHPLGIIPPPSRPAAGDAPERFTGSSPAASVQFNVKTSAETKRAFQMLAIQTGRRVPELLEEAARLLQNKYGDV